MCTCAACAPVSRVHDTRTKYFAHVSTSVRGGREEDRTGEGTLSPSPSTPFDVSCPQNDGCVYIQPLTPRPRCDGENFKTGGGLLFGSAQIISEDRTSAIFSGYSGAREHACALAARRQSIANTSCRQLRMQGEITVTLFFFSRKVHFPVILESEYRQNFEHTPRNNPFKKWTANSN